MLIAIKAQAEDDETLGLISLGFSLPISEEFSLYGGASQAEHRLGGKLFEVGLSRKITQKTSINVSYLNLRNNPSVENSSPRDHRIRLSASYRSQYGKYRFSHRSLIERRWRHVTDDFRYRSKFELKKNLQLGNLTFTPRLSLEPFYDFQLNKVTLGLINAGVQFPVGDRGALTLGYVRLHDFIGKNHLGGPEVAFSKRF